jgi:hypothetical protein
VQVSEILLILAARRLTCPLRSQTRSAGAIPFTAAATILLGYQAGFAIALLTVILR